MHRQRQVGAMTAAVLGWAASAVWACPYSVREAGFVPFRPRPYQLYCLVRREMPGRDPLVARIQEEAAALEDANVEVQVVDLTAEPAHEAARQAERLKVERVPAAVLVSPRGEALRVAWPAQEPVSAEAVRTVLSSVVHSPARREILSRIVEHWCVAVLMPGKDPTENQRASAEVAAAARDMVGTFTEMGKEIRTGPHVVTVSADDPSEAVLRWSLGLDGPPASGPRLAVIFGMGWRLGPVLEGANLTGWNAAELFRLLGRTCACTSEWTALLGPMIPRVWTAAHRRQVQEHLGFDPHSPQVRLALPMAWVEAAGGPGAAPEAGLGGYTEIALEGPAAGQAEEEPFVAMPAVAPTTSGPATAPARPPDSRRAPTAPVAPADLEARLGGVFLVAVAVLLVIVAGGSVLIVRRARGPRRRSGSP